MGSIYQIDNNRMYESSSESQSGVIAFHRGQGTTGGIDGSGSYITSNRFAVMGLKRVDTSDEANTNQRSGGINMTGLCQRSAFSENQGIIADSEQPD